MQHLKCDNPVVHCTQSVLRGAKGLQGYKDRADGYICAVLPRSISPISRLQYSPGTLSVLQSPFFALLAQKKIGAGIDKILCNGMYD